MKNGCLLRRGDGILQAADGATHRALYVEDGDWVLACNTTTFINPKDPNDGCKSIAGALTKITKNTPTELTCRRSGCRPSWRRPAWDMAYEADGRKVGR